jgi:hypothetical protein
LRPFITASFALLVGLFSFALGTGLTASTVAGATIAAAATIAAGWLSWRRRCFALDESGVPRSLAMVSAAATVLALLQLARLTVFVVLPSRADFSQFPSSAFEVRHSCATAYYVAAKAASETPNVYDDALYTAPDDNPTAIRRARKLGSFDIDVYEYPPPFLVLPRCLLLVAPEFVPFRMVWFGLNGLVLLAALVMVARSLGSEARARAMLLSPLVLAAIPTINFLQKGNVQGVVIAIAMMAMLLFERRRWALGGALLAFAMMSKLFPGLLVVYLLTQRAWRAVAWTAVFALVFVLLSALSVGAPGYMAFVDHFPRLLGGEAFPAFRNPGAVAINYSVPGLVFKLKLFGVPGMGFTASKIVGWLYTIGALAVTVLVGKRTLRKEHQPLVWLAILVIATLRSPFLPLVYASFPALWLAVCLAARARPETRTIVLVVGVWTFLSFFWPVDRPMDPRLLSTITLIPQAITAGVAVVAIRRALGGALS